MHQKGSLRLVDTKIPNITIFAGISGIAKSNFINNFITKSGCSDKILNLNFEKELISGGKSGTEEYADISSYLDIPSSRIKIDSLETTFQTITKKIDARDTKITDIFLNIHLSYFKNSEFFPPFIPLFFSQLRTKIPNTRIRIITLIDDVFSIWNRIKKKEEVYLNTSLRLREILAWRSLESLNAEALSRHLNSQLEGDSKITSNYMVSIRHPFSTFSNLIFQEDPVKLYLSYPISEPRKNADEIAEINEFRKTMYDIASRMGAVIFDPVTIDEFAMETALKQLSEGNEEVEIQSKHRWPLDLPDLLVDFEWPIKIPKQQIEEVKNEISNQIRSRDFTLVDSSQYLAVYRPIYKKKPSTGVDAEIKHAKEYGRRVVVYHPAEDKEEKTKSTHPFLSNVDMYDDKGKFYDHLLKLIKERMGKVK